MGTKTATAINKDILLIGVLFFVFGFVTWLRISINSLS
ncbi:hypothetical protein BH10BAC3_BH10BAC3_23820 [soil metagenome]